MMSSRFSAEELPVEHVRHPGDGMPVGGVGIEGRPSDALACEPVLDVLVGEDVFGVVVVDEIVFGDGKVDCDGDYQ